MATTAWFVRTGGADANSGGSDSNGARVTADAEGGTLVANVLTTVTDLTAAGLLDTDAVNMVIGGVQVVREIVSHTQFTITLTGGAGNETYTGWRAGGARASINKVVGTGAGENVPLASGDTVTLESGATFTETSIVIDVVIYLRGRGATIDGTGGGAGTDILTSNTAIAPFISDLILANAVDIGCVLAQGGTPMKVRAQSCGGVGVLLNAGAGFSYLSARACGGVGLSYGGNSSSSSLIHCEAGDCTGYGIVTTRGGSIADCLVYDNAGGGINMVSDSGNIVRVFNCTIEGNTLIGVNFASVAAGGNVSLANCIITNNGTGASASADASASQLFIDYNLYFGNSTARTNIPVGANDVATDPAFTDAANDDYSIKSTGGAYKTGYSPFKNPTLNALNIGAVPGPGSAEETGDYPSEDDVRDGVDYANTTLEGNLVLPTEAQVESGVGFGSSGTEFEGSLVAGGAGRLAWGIRSY